MEPIEIRPATPADVPVVVEMIKGLAEYERLSDQVRATEEQVRRTLFGPKPAAEVALAVKGDVCAGIAVFFATYSTFLGQPGIYLEDLFVRPEWRGRGIGLSLLRHIARVAVRRGCGRVEWGVLDWNESAIGFYEKLGARALTGWKKYRLTGDALAALGQQPERSS